MPISADISKIKTQVLYDKFAKEEGLIDRWWLVEDHSMLHEHAFPVALAIRQNMFSRRKQHFYYQMLYSDLSANMYQSQMGNSMSNMGNWQSFQNRITLNVVQNCIDTAASMISKNKPKPLFLTDGAIDYMQKEKAKKLTKYVTGVFDDVNLYEKMQRVFTDACIYGTGFLKIHQEDMTKKIKAEWCFVEEILVDEVDGAKEAPSQMHQLKFMARDELIARYPDYADEIMSSNNALPGATVSRTTADVVPFLESWHLPSTPDSNDGLHCITIETATLFAESYEKDYFPIQVFRWYHQPIGFWGRGIAQELSPLQNEINEILQTIQEAQKMVAVPVWMVENSSMVAEDHLMSNDIGRWVEYTGTAPQLQTPPAVQPELYAHLQYLEDRAYKICGVSQANASGVKPVEVKSGAAIREVQDIAHGRFEVISQNWESMFMTIAKIIVDQSKDLYEENPDLAVKSRDKKFIETIKWEDVDMEEDEFEITLFPISGLPKTPAGRLDVISEYMANGFIPKEQAMDLLDFPDLEAFSTVETSTVKLTNRIISNIKEQGFEGFQQPNPFMDVGLAFRIASLEAVNAELQGVPEEHIDYIRTFAEKCMDLIKAAQAQQQAMQAPSPAAPPQTKQAPPQPAPQTPPSPAPQQGPMNGQSQQQPS